ncbi:MAG: aminopeptidase [Nanoarchaeota archaeon]|nr:aminopeptidase [Nanoarchaeota archaeon]
MHKEQFKKWVKERKVKDLIEKNARYFEFILNNCLGISKEEILIVGDYGDGENIIAPILVGCYLKARGKCKVNLIMQGVKSKNQQADWKVLEAMDKLPEGNVIILCLSNMLGKLGHLGKSYRKFCRLRKHKFTSTTGMGSLDLDKLKMVIKSLNTNYVSLRKKGMVVKKILDEGKEIKVKTKAGTDLVLGIEGMKAMTSIGIYNEPGLGGNIPTGEVFTPVKIRQADGLLVVDVSVRHKEGTLLVKGPLKITIKEGRVVGLEGEGAELVEQTLVEAEERAQFPERVRLIGEFGIGLNPDAEIVGSTIIDEKVLGTAHVAIGSNYWYGGQIKTIIHLDQVFKDPEIFIDGKKLKI